MLLTPGFLKTVCEHMCIHVYICKHVCVCVCESVWLWVRMCVSVYCVSMYVCVCL